MNILDNLVKTTHRFEWVWFTLIILQRFIQWAILMQSHLQAKKVALWPLLIIQSYLKHNSNSISPVHIIQYMLL